MKRAVYICNLEEAFVGEFINVNSIMTVYKVKSFKFTNQNLQFFRADLQSEHGDYICIV
jgi:hypothetical protein